MSTTETTTIKKNKPWLNSDGSFNGAYASFNPNEYAANGYYDATQFAADYENDRNAYLQEQNLLENKDAATGSAAKIKDKAITAAKDTEANKVQYADMRRQLMEKYIPETLLAQGIANTGYTADALLKAENLYNQYAHNAMSERASAEQNALSEYNLAEQNALSEYNTALNNLKMSQNEQAYKNFIEAEGRRAKAEDEEEKKQDEIEANNTEYRTIAVERFNELWDDAMGDKNALNSIANRVMAEMEFITEGDENQQTYLESLKTTLNNLVSAAGGTPTKTPEQIEKERIAANNKLRDDAYAQLKSVLGENSTSLPAKDDFDKYWGSAHSTNFNKSTFLSWLVSNGILTTGTDAYNDMAGYLELAQQQGGGNDSSLNTRQVATVSGKTGKKHAFDASAGDVFRVLYKGTYYKVTAGEPIDDTTKIYTAITAQNDDGSYKYNDGDVVEVNDKLYVVTGTANGTRKVFPLETKGFGWGKSLSKLEAAAGV